MRKTRYTEEQIIRVLQEVESGGRKVVTYVLRLNTTEPTVVECGSLGRRPLERAER
jgi:hypothetical protein